MSSVDDPKALIEDILQQVAKSKSLSDYELKLNMAVEVGDGFVSQFYKAQIIDKSSEEVLWVAIKKAPVWEFDFSSLFNNEILFYTEVVPALQRMHTDFGNVPQYLVSQCEPGRTFIAMEDLKPQGYQLHEKKKYFDQEHLEFIFCIYGKFHATSFVLRKRHFEEYQQIHSRLKDVFPVFVEMEQSKQMFESALRAAVDSLDQGSAAYQIAKDILENSKKILLSSFRYLGKYRCSTHGDCWSNNMLFKYSERGQLQDVKLIDFQLARDGTPVHDLSYFFYSSASRADMDRLEDYLRIYHKSLSKTLELLDENPDEILSWDVLLKEWKENAAMGILLGIYLWQVKLLDKAEYVDMMKKLSDEGAQGAKMDFSETGNFFIGLLAHTLTSDAYKLRTRNILEHAVDYGVLTAAKIQELLSSEE